MTTEIELPSGILKIIVQRERIDTIANRIDNSRSGILSWRRSDESDELVTDLYRWRNDLGEEFPERVEEHVKRTPAIHDLGYLKPASDDGKRGLFEYGFNVAAHEEIVRIKYKTEGITAILDRDVTEARIEVRGENVPPLLHLPADWSLLMQNSIKQMHMRVNVFARWKPELTDKPRMIKIPDTLEIEWALHDPEKARTYTETEVMA